MSNKKLLKWSVVINLALLSLSNSYAEPTDAEAEKIRLRLQEIEQEERAAQLEKSGYYVERRSYGTQRETDPPRYVRQANKTWLRDYGFDDVKWLDVGFEYRTRSEIRDNDFRRKGQTYDTPTLLRSRAYFAVKDILDPLRFTLELQDSRRVNSQFSSTYDTRDFNNFEPLQGYLELYFKDSILGKDSLGNNIPISARLGRQAFELVDRRLVARNEWRNTTNNFDGLRVILGQQKNDWQVELLALKPVQRFNDKTDQPVHAQDFYGVLGDWRKWSQYVTLQPFYFRLKQDGARVEYDQNGKPIELIDEGYKRQIDRDIHTGGLRAFGIVGKTGWDWDAQYIQQWGDQQRINKDRSITKEKQDAYAYNAELGYTFKNPWKTRLSAFYGVASGDRDPANKSNERFERLFGFARPWSNDDYIQMENIEATKVHAEFEPPQFFIEKLKVDVGYNWYRLRSNTDRWNGINGSDLRDKEGNSGKDIGQEFDVRLRFPVNDYIATNIGYAHFWAGDFTKRTLNDPERKNTSNFLYVEMSFYGF